MCRLDYDPLTLKPVCNQETLESNIPDLYLAGSVVAGRNTNTIFIENSREHGEIIQADIQNKVLKKR
jgi:thioredoxin reductase (NADPH)